MTEEQLRFYEEVDRRNEMGIPITTNPDLKKVRDVITAPALKMSEDELIQNKAFQDEALVLYTKTMEAKAARPSFKHSITGRNVKLIEEKYLTDPADIAEWAVNEITWFRNNDMKMIASIPMLAKADPNLVVAMANVDYMYEATELDWGQFGRGAYQAILSPTSLLGFGLVAKGAGKIVGGGARLYLRDLAQRVVAKKGAMAVAAGMVEGGIWAGTSTATQQNLYSEASKRAPNVGEQGIDWGEVKTDALTGVAFGGTLGLFLASAPAALKRTRDYVTELNVSRGQGTYGGNSFTDSQWGAETYAVNGGVDWRTINAKISANNTAFVDQEAVSGSELSYYLDLDKDFGDKVKPTSEYMTDPDVIDSIERKGIDVVAYPEKLPERAVSDEASEKARMMEVEDDMQSLNADGVSTSYSTFGTPNIEY